MKEENRKPEKWHDNKPFIHPHVNWILYDNLTVERQVLVRARALPRDATTRMRVWKNACLRDLDSNHTSRLLWVYGASVHPHWMHIPKGEEWWYFYLIFDPLHPTCTRFYADEGTNETWAFIQTAHERNDTDTYDVDFYVYNPDPTG